MAEACIFFADGLEEIEGLTVVDLFRRANISIVIVSINGTYKIEGSHHISIKADQLFESLDFENTKMFILPGGMPGTTNLSRFQPLCRLLTKSASQGKYVAAICAAPSVLGGLGLLKGKAATCYPGFEDKLIGACCQKDNVVTDGNVITSRGMGTAIEFGGKLIEILRDKETADKILSSIMYQ